MKKLATALLLSSTLLALPSFAGAAGIPQTGLSCEQTAVTVREDAIMTALDTYTTAWKDALTVRRDAIVEAWNLPKKRDRNAAIKAANNEYTATVKAARLEFKSVRLAAQDQYQADIAACNAPIVTPAE